MTIDSFKKASLFSTLKEIERVCYLAFFYLKTENIVVFSAADASKWLQDAGGAAPNQHRLEVNLRACRDTVKHPNGWRLKDTFIEGMESSFLTLGKKSQEVVDQGTVLPRVLYENTRGYIESIAKQINASYEHNIFDGCAMLMRRLEEMLLIMSYQHMGIENEIKDSQGHFVMLDGIVKNAASNQNAELSRGSQKSLNDFRDLGNFSAHRMLYLCKREYIQEKIPEYRALVEELLHKAGLR